MDGSSLDTKRHHQHNTINMLQILMGTEACWKDLCLSEMGENWKSKKMGRLGHERFEHISNGSRRKTELADNNMRQLMERGSLSQINIPS